VKLAKDIFRDLIENFELIDKQIGELKAMQSMLDKELNKTYHEIEVSKANAYEGYKFYEKIREITQTRRIVKSELKALTDIRSSLPFAKHEKYHARKNTCNQSIKYNTDYESDYFKNFNISGDDIAI
jgi:hypothetical protein